MRLPHAARARAVPAPCRRDGHTLVELVMACTVLAIASAVALPRLDTARWRADAVQRQLRGTLQQAQRLAVQNQFDVVVGFDTANARLRIAEDSTNDRRITPDERTRWVTLEEGARFALPPAAAPDVPGGAPVAGSALEERDGLPSVTFHRSGAASTDVGVYVRVAYKDREDRRAVTVVQSTGRTAAYRWREGRWEDARP